jgi:hypothetical protein
MPEYIYRLATTAIGTPNFAAAGLAPPPEGTYKMTRDLDAGVCILAVPEPLEDTGPGAAKPLEGGDAETVFDTFKAKLDNDLEAIRIKEEIAAQPITEFIDTPQINIIEMTPDDLKESLK